MYRTLVRPFMFRMHPERAHKAAEVALRVPVVWNALRPVSGAGNPRLRTTVAGLQVPTPVGVAAGLDKDARFLGALLDLGFGFATGGTVTQSPRPGNPEPRVIRQPERGALINSMGFPGAGLEAAEKRFRRYSRRRDRLFASIAGTIEDEIVECHRRLQPLVAAVELNVSSPNTSGLRVFHEPGRLRGLVESLAKHKSVPLLVKLPPWGRDRDDRRKALLLVETALNAGADGLVIANTHPVEHSGLAVGRGGLSGAPLFEHTVRMVAETRAVVHAGPAIIGSGGVSSARHVWQLLAVGASATQIYTGFIYEGPGLPGKINRGLITLMNRVGARSIMDIEGPPPD
ncbi:MAG: dihydroorotate dehydrogenase (quinone) [Dehalococcoidia bacterium]